MKKPNLTRSLTATVVLFLLGWTVFNIHQAVEAREYKNTFKELISEYQKKQIILFRDNRRYFLEEIRSDYLVIRDAISLQTKVFVPFNSILTLITHEDRIFLNLNSGLDQQLSLADFFGGIKPNH